MASNFVLRNFALLQVVFFQILAILFAIGLTGRFCTHAIHLQRHGLVGLVVKRSASRAVDPGFGSCLCGDFSGSSRTSDLKIGTSVATLPGAWCYGVSAGLIYSFQVSMAPSTIFRAEKRMPLCI